MQTQPRFGPFRRVLLPHTGEEPLTRTQGRRLIAVWALLFTTPMVLCTLLVAVTRLPLANAALLVGIVLVSGLVLFGVTAWVVVKSINRTARTLQERRARTSS